MMQIVELVLYSKQGQKRILPFRLGSVNVITGSSMTGKTALIEIVDYCLGNPRCMVPEGIIRDTVDWYGVRLQFPDSQMFIARQNPPRGQATSTSVYIHQADVTESPNACDLSPNSDIESLKQALSTKIGIGPNKFTPPPGQTRRPLEANIRHALAYCFQEQDVIASRVNLFHGQSDTWEKQAIKDTLPYFLGAMREDQVALESQFDIARRELRGAERALREVQDIEGAGVSKAVGLASEAMEVGLLQSGDIPEDPQTLASLLTEVVAISPGDSVSFDASELTQLQAELTELKEELDHNSEELAAAKAFAGQMDGFTTETRQQELRLKSIELFDLDVSSPDTCPLCSQKMPTELPTSKAMRGSLEDLRESLSMTKREKPRVDKYIQNLESTRQDLREKLQHKNEAIKAILREEEAATRLRDLTARQARVIGRASLWLESVNPAEGIMALREKLSEAQQRVSDLESMLTSEDSSERLMAVINRLMFRMTELARRLGLEHSDNPVRLDPRNLSVQVDTQERSISLKMIGGGKNWVGYHLVTLLALHEHFIRQTRPVPRFIFLDQATQVYYPRDRDDQLQGSLKQLSDEDREAVRQMFDLVLDMVEGLRPSLQVIITDHADLSDQRFAKAVVERWRGGQALVPPSWSTSP